MKTSYFGDEPLAVIEEEAVAVARCFGIAVPEAAAASLVERILHRLGGMHIYVPRKTAREREKMHKEIVRRFNGRNLADLAKEYGMTARHARRIISEAVARIEDGAS
ncbi:Mor transcription activator family protein [Variovorax sp. NFACC27]|uniref:Mor transcription activator family protein n=1 Tax=unclassified Variovorax TaxID=663243 RepID=UPI0008995E7B|nr:Mor transcription activator family protein [Variovorax sp. NFACC28]SEG86014.1 Mor transcription activator family protein [Variovorax sp. NFACC29]SFD22652.1 Mor transcription activator family protein [Variovorax sp. NFACC26]SFG29473.1 Mor transcription activator family protein [Variovorax sp. NFACC27]